MTTGSTISSVVIIPLPFPPSKPLCPLRAFPTDPLLPSPRLPPLQSAKWKTDPGGKGRRNSAHREKGARKCGGGGAKREEASDRTDKG